MKKLRHATIRSLAERKTKRMVRIAHRAAWLEEVKGYDVVEINRRLIRKGCVNYLTMIRKQYRMHMNFVLSAHKSQQGEG